MFDCMYVFSLTLYYSGDHDGNPNATPQINIEGHFVLMVLRVLQVVHSVTLSIVSIVLAPRLLH